MIKFLDRIRNYIQGLLEVSRIQTPKYSFMVEKFDITYQGVSIKTKINYTPVGCYRPFKIFASELNDENTVDSGIFGLF